MPLEFVYNKIKNTLRKIDMKLERAKYNYIDKMSKDIEYPEGGLYDVVYESSCKWPHNTALQYFDTEITYKELIKKINKVAAALKALGAEKGDYITVCMPNTPEAIKADVERTDAVFQKVLGRSPSSSTSSTVPCRRPTPYRSCGGGSSGNK